MQYGHGLPTRPAYYDRNALPKAILVGPILVSPHATTVRFTYTVPSGKLAWIDGAVAALIRSAAPSVLAYAFCEVLYTAVVAAAHTAAYAHVFSTTLGDKDSGELGQSGVMQAGDTLQGIDSDASTGGSFIVVESAKIFEFSV